MISFRPISGSPVGRLGRAALIAWAMFLTGGFAVARCLEPDPRGFGTHQQLGLPVCTIRILFSRPCPGCGMTTCFSHFVRGNLTAAARANPAGLVLAMVCLLMIPWSLVSAIRGYFWLIDDPMAALAWTVALVGAVAILAWGMALWRRV